MALISGAGLELPTVRSSILSLECFKDQLPIVPIRDWRQSPGPTKLHLRASIVLSTPTTTLFFPVSGQSLHREVLPTSLVESRLAPKT